MVGIDAGARLLYFFLPKLCVIGSGMAHSCGGTLDTVPYRGQIFNYTLHPEPRRLI